MSELLTALLLRCRPFLVAHLASACAWFNHPPHPLPWAPLLQGSVSAVARALLCMLIVLSRPSVRLHLHLLPRFDCEARSIFRLRSKSDDEERGHYDGQLLCSSTTQFAKGSLSSGSFVPSCLPLDIDWP